MTDPVKRLPDMDEEGIDVAIIFGTSIALSVNGMADKPQGVLPKLSQEMLAEMIGTTRSRVNFFMNKFRKLGFIEYNGGLKINTSLLSVVLHDTPE